MNQSAVQAFLLALTLLAAFAIARARGGKDKLLNLTVIGAFMTTGSAMGFVLGFSARSLAIGNYLAFELMWALGCVAAVGRIRKNRRFASIDATGMA